MVCLIFDDFLPQKKPLSVQSLTKTISFLLSLALGELYNSTNGPKWVHNDNWMSSYSPCDEDNGWYGIDCNSGQISGVFVSL